MLLAISAGLPVAAGAASTVSPRLAAARGRAAAVAATVDRLELSAEQATEAYDAATDSITQLSTQQVLAAEQLDAAEADAARASAAGTADVRRLYESDSRFGILGAVLSGGAPADLLDRVRIASAVLGADAAAAGTARGGAGEAAGIASRVASLSNRQRLLSLAAGRSADRIRRTLAAESALLAGADGDVRRIVAAERRSRAAAAAKAFAARLAAAQRAAARAAAITAANPAAGSTAHLPAPTAVAAAAVTAARSRLGSPYQWGATGPDAFDCSGLTGWAYAMAGLALPRTAAQQWYAGPHPPLAEIAPGDLLFWATDAGDPATIHHVALYLGGGLMIAAPHTGAVVSVQAVYATGYFGAVRPTAA